MKTLSILLTMLPSLTLSLLASEAEVLNLWSGEIPGPPAVTQGEPEQDFTQPEDRLIAGKRIIKLGNVSQPQMHVFLPAAEKAHGGAVVVCPGGGFSILAWDLEGTEVAHWLNELGFAAMVLKYRVPTRQHDDPGKWQGPVMDAQRALSLTRAHAEKWDLDPDRIGILGFSAGGQTAALAATHGGQRLYPASDATDQPPCHADFALLIYPGGIANDDGSLRDIYQVTEKTPPMFFVHTTDDNVTCLSSVALFGALKKAGVSAEMHVFATGGHGYGLRPTEEAVTRWPQLAAMWLSKEIGVPHTVPKVD
jgi:acetyl esterase/lipase